MITLVTGGPGTGKTAWLISQLLLLKEQQPYREFFIHGIQQFTGFAHTTIFCRSQLCDLCQKQKIPEGSLFVEDYPQWFRPHYLIVVDELQRIWPLKSSSTEATTRLQTHRHYGLDFWFVTQSPKLIHVDVKTMVGRHIHLVAKWSGRKQFEWPEIRENVNSRTDAVERAYKLPKHVYGLYKSAEVHTKQEKRVPLSVYAFSACIVLSLILVVFLYNRIKSRTETQKPIDTVNIETAQSSSVTSSLQPGSIQPVSKTTSLVESLKPVVPGVPWTAPYYAELAKPVSIPQIKGCIKIDNPEDKRCSCYTQQGTVIAMSYEMCITQLRQRAFNPFIPDHDHERESPGERRRGHEEKRAGALFSGYAP